MYNPIKPYKHQILKLIESTWKTPYARIKRGVYPLIEKKFSYPEVDHTDGIGTKGLYHWKAGSFRVAAIDALAMNLNDLALVRAIPYKLSNHITVPIEDNRVFKIVQAIAAECRKYKIAMVGGENSFHNNMEGMDISMTVSGFVKKPQVNACKVGDVLIGLQSNGLHSNGMTKVREVFGNTLRKEFTQPTKVYVYDILPMLERCQVNGMMHITGGAFSKLKDILHNADAVIKQPRKLGPQRIFLDLYKKGLSSQTMYTTFNCGIGFVLSVPEKEVSKVLSCLHNVAVIGFVTKGNGTVRITSAFDGKVLEL